MEIYTVELYRKVRLACAEGMSRRAAASYFNISRDTVDKAMAYSEPPGCRRTAPIKRPKLDGFIEIIDAWLEADKTVHRKQRHTAKRIFDRLREEHGFTGGYTIIKDYVRERERRGREMFVPLAHPPGHAQADFGEAVVVIDGVEQKAFEELTHRHLAPRFRLTLHHGPSAQGHFYFHREPVLKVDDHARVTVAREVRRSAHNIESLTKGSVAFVFVPHPVHHAAPDLVPGRQPILARFKAARVGCFLFLVVFLFLGSVDV